jgi:hypothetical protein
VKAHSLCFALASMVTTLALSGCVRFYSADPIESVVVDAETGKPIAGVVVVAHWQAELNTLGGRAPGTQVKIAEAVTDEKGSFRIAAWGPKLVVRGVIEEKSPELVLFKPGYEPSHLTDGSGIDADRSWKRKSDWVPKQIALNPFSGSNREYARALHDLSGTMEIIIYLNEGWCLWRDMPAMLRAMDRQDAIFKKDNTTPLTLAATLRAGETFYAGKGCGSVNRFINGE